MTIEQKKLVIAIKEYDIDHKFESKIYQLLIQKTRSFINGTTVDIPRLNELKKTIIEKYLYKEIVIFSKYRYPILNNFIMELRLNGINVQVYGYSKWENVITYYKEHVE